MLTIQKHSPKFDGINKTYDLLPDRRTKSWNGMHWNKHLKPLFELTQGEVRIQSSSCGYANDESGHKNDPDDWG